MMRPARTTPLARSVLQVYDQISRIRKGRVLRGFSMTGKRVAVIGAGVIGRGWIALFAKAGFQVSVYDAAPDAYGHAAEAVAVTLRDLASYGLTDDPDAAFARVAPAASQAEAVAGAFFIQESVHERVEIKRAVLREIDALADPSAIISSSCSSLLPADIFEAVKTPARCIVAHPFNPPHLMPLVELLPGPLTSEATLAATSALMTDLGQSPVVLRKAVPGYVVNRLQAAVINEAMHLVGQGVISPSDLDLCMTASLGRRWAFLGPFETMDLNADDGVAGYAGRFQGSYEELGADLDASDPWPAGALEAVVRSRRADLPLDQIGARQEWRNRHLMAMLATPLRD
jgi:L-gulonate 3-dehydrogenase